MACFPTSSKGIPGNLPGCYVESVVPGPMQVSSSTLLRSRGRCFCPCSEDRELNSHCKIMEGAVHLCNILLTDLDKKANTAPGVSLRMDHFYPLMLGTHHALGVGPLGWTCG